MLNNDFFSITDFQQEENTVKATLVLNPEHLIFEGHFPDFPVVPGVCMMQMMREVMEKVLNKKTNIKKADHLKFLSLINPQETTVVDTVLTYKNLEDGNISVDAKIFNDTITFFKMRCVLSLN